MMIFLFVLLFCSCIAAAETRPPLRASVHWLFNAMLLGAITLMWMVEQGRL